MATQVWDPTSYARHAHFVPELGSAVLTLLDAHAGERILDLGSGDGVLTQKLLALGCDVVAVDSSAAQVMAACARGIDARVMDGEQLDFDSDFDAVFSNAALHWMTRPDAVLAGVRRALRSGGRFVAELGGHNCVITIRRALVAALQRRGIDGEALDPWYFPTADDYAARLVAADLHADVLLEIPRPTPLPTDIAGWLETFAQNFLTAIPQAERQVFLQEVRQALHSELCAPDGTWFADYTRLRVRAYKR